MMGFAEDKFLKYLEENIKLLTDLRLLEILMYLPCLTTQNQERLRQQLLLNGNEATIWEFVHDLKKRDNWVNQFLEALRICQHTILAEDLQRVYDGFRPVRRAVQPINPPPRIIQADQSDQSNPQIHPANLSNIQCQEHPSSPPKTSLSYALQSAASDQKHYYAAVPIQPQTYSSLPTPGTSSEVQQNKALPRPSHLVQDLGPTQFNSNPEHQPAPCGLNTESDNRSLSSPKPINQELQTERSSEPKLPVAETSPENKYQVANDPEGEVADNSHEYSSNSCNTHQVQSPDSSQPSFASVIHPKNSSANVPPNPSVRALSSQTTDPRTNNIHPVPTPNIHTSHFPASSQPSSPFTQREQLQASAHPSPTTLPQTDEIQAMIRPSFSPNILTDPVSPFSPQASASNTWQSHIPTNIEPSSSPITNTAHTPASTQPSTPQITHTKPRQPSTRQPSFPKSHPDQHTTDPRESSRPVTGNVLDSTRTSSTTVETNAPTLPAPVNGTNQSTLSTARESDVQQANLMTYTRSGRSYVHPVRGDDTNEDYCISKPGVLLSSCDNIRIGEDVNHSNMRSSDFPLQISRTSDPLMISSSDHPVCPPNHRDRFSPMNQESRKPRTEAAVRSNGNTIMEHPKDPEENEFRFNTSGGQSFRLNAWYPNELPPPRHGPEEYSFDNTETGRFSLSYNEEADVDLTEGNADRKDRRSSVKIYGVKNGNEKVKQTENKDREHVTKKENDTNNILIVSLVVVALSVSVFMLWKKKN